MTKFNASIVTAVAALFISGGAFGAPLQPAAGNGPYFNQAVAMSSTLTRSAVEAQAATDEPAAGQNDAVARAATHSTLTRSAVEAEAAAHEPAAGEEEPGYATASVKAPAMSWHFSQAAKTAARMPAAGEFSSWAQPVALNSALTRQAVEAEAVVHEPTAGEM
jgi:hypothetical protein